MAAKAWTWTRGAALSSGASVTSAPDGRCRGDRDEDQRRVETIAATTIALGGPQWRRAIETDRYRTLAITQPVKSRSQWIASPLAHT
jgi:hypothetical protein